MNTEIFHFGHEWDIPMNLKNYEANDYMHNFDFCYSPHTNYVFRILQEVGAKRNVFK